MAEKIEVVLSHPIRGRGEAGDRIALEAAEAKALISAGYAAYATKRDAKAAGDDEAPTASRAR